MTQLSTRDLQSRLSAVIFDMDGVLVDTEPAYFEIERQAFAGLGLDVSDDEHLGYVGMSSRAMWTHVREKHRCARSIDELVSLGETAYRDHFENIPTLRPVRGIPELIADLRAHGIRLAVASSSTLNMIHMVLKAAALSDAFDTVVTADMVARSKPAPDIFLYAARRLGCMPDSCCVIEDSENGVAAALSAGMKCIAFANPNSGRQDVSRAHVVVDSMGRVDTRLCRSLWNGDESSRDSG